MSQSNLTRDEAKKRAEAVANVSYKLDFILSDSLALPAFDCETQVNFDCKAHRVDTFLDCTATEITQITLDGKPLDLDSFSNHRIALNQVSEGEHQVNIKGKFPYNHTGVGLHRFVDPADKNVYLYTHFEPFDAHQVFPCFDQPDIKATFSITVEAPKKWEIISNNNILSQENISAQNKRVNFGSTPVISTYLVTVVAGPYYSTKNWHNDLEVSLYCRQSLKEYLEPEEIFGITKQGLDFFTTTFAMDYPFEKYGQVFVPEFNMGAMEHPGCVTNSETLLFRSAVTQTMRGRRANVILHEMAHMWFGNLVTMRWWDDLWLNESFATYMAFDSQFKATQYIRSWIDFLSGQKAFAARQDQLPTTHPIVADIVDIEAVHLNFDGITYAKGASVLRQLVAWVGEAELYKGMREYFQLYKWKNTELADFLSALSEASGRELESWAVKWLQTSGMSKLQASYSVAGNKLVNCKLEQVGTGPYQDVRPHRVAVGLYREDSDGWIRRKKRLEVDLDDFELPLKEFDGEPVPELLLVNDDDLTFAKVHLDSRSLNTMAEKLSRIEDPLARCLAWSFAWDMNRDATLSPSDFIRLFSKHAISEKVVEVLERLMLQVLTTIDVYAHPDNRATGYAVVHQSADHILTNDLDLETDLQLIWARCWIATAHTEQHIEKLHELLDGKRSLAQVVIDIDLRWQIIVRLAVLGHADESFINNELQRDLTDFGQRKTAEALAATPTPEAKAKAWDQLVGPETIPLQLLAAIIKGFDQPNQEGLIEEYIEKYQELVPKWWAEKTLDEATYLTQGLFPKYNTDTTIISMADSLLSNPTLPGPAKRILLEAKDGTLRAQKTREFDKARSANNARL